MNIVGSIARYVEVAGQIEREAVRKASGAFCINVCPSASEIDLKNTVRVALDHEQPLLAGAQRQAVGVSERASDDLAASIGSEPQQKPVVLVPGSRVRHVEVAAPGEHSIVGADQPVCAGLAGEYGPLARSLHPHDAMLRIANVQLRVIGRPGDTTAKSA